MVKLLEILKEILLEEKTKRDRCLRIADRKFSKPSAYKSGAVVRCRQGKIWKDLKEENLNEIGEANAKPYKWKEEYNDDMGVEVSFETESGLEYSVGLERDIYEDIPILDVEFVAGMIDPDFGGGMSSKITTNRGELFKVMSTIVDIIRYYVKNTEAQGVTYSPSKKGDETISTNQRNTLYKAFLQKQIPGVKIKEKGDYIVAIFPKNKKLKEDESLHKWFKRQGPSGKEGGWVDCNTCRKVDGKTKCKACGRKKGESRAKYPSCRPTPSQCKRPGKGKTWGKTK